MAYRAEVDPQEAALREDLSGLAPCRALLLKRSTTVPSPQARAQKTSQ